jgi:uncharacterized membrane protein YbhN (UPF0104 family)
MENKAVKNNYLKILVSLAISAAILLFFLRELSVEQVKAAFTSLSFSFLLIFIACSLISTILRAIQYRILLENKLSFKDVLLITLVRNFSVDLLPARTASLFLYTYFTKKKGVDIAEGTTSYVISAFYGTIGTIFLLATLTIFATANFDKTLLMWPLVTLLILTFLVVIYAHIFVLWLLKFNLFNKHLKVRTFLENVLAYLKNHDRFKERLNLFVLNLVVKVLKYVSAYLLFEGVVRAGFSIGNLAVFSVGLATAEISAIVPVQGIGGLGTWEAAFTLIFSQLAIDSGNTFLTGLVLHVVTQCWEYAIGIIAFIYLMAARRE